MIRIITEPVDNIIIGYEHITENTTCNILKSSVVMEDEDFFSKISIDEIFNSSKQLTDNNSVESIPKNSRNSILYTDIINAGNELNKIREKVTRLKEIKLENLINGVTAEETDNDLKEANNLLAENEALLKKLTDRYEKEKQMVYQRRNELLDSSITPIYYSSICLLIRDENKYLIEWLNYHLPLVDHIYIYDNGIKERTSEIISEDNFSSDMIDKITIIDWSGSHGHVQEDAYNNFLETYGSETRWVAFIDSDEFLTLDSEKTINEILEANTSYTEIQIGFVEYNANGLANYEDKPVQERFTQEFNKFAELYHKEFVQPVRIDHMDRHYAIYEDPYGKYVDENKELLHIRHYYTKSYEEWIEKMKRGSSDPAYLKKYGEFFVYNPDLEYLKNENDTIDQNYNA